VNNCINFVFCAFNNHPFGPWKRIKWRRWTRL
jgi:hypothetical protein